MQKKKILYLITKATWGGAQRYVYDLATHLPKNEFEPVVAYGTSGKLSQDLKTAGIETYEIPSLGRDIAIISDIRSFFAILKCIRTTKPDAIHLNSSKAAALGALAARIAGIRKIIFTVHGWPFKENRTAFANRIIRMISWLTAALSHSVIVVSKTDLDIGKTFGGGVAHKIHYIPIGITVPDFLTREDASTGLGVETNLPRIVTIAELTANKGVRYAIEATAILKTRNINISYFIIGDGEERQTLEQLARERNVSDRVHFFGFVAKAAQYLKAFDVFLLPSIKEGMPYVLLEAATAQVPIITTDVVDPMFLALAFDETKVKPQNPVAIADTISSTLKGDRTRPEFHSPLTDMVQRTSALY